MSKRNAEQEQVLDHMNRDPLLQHMHGVLVSDPAAYEQMVGIVRDTNPQAATVADTLVRATVDRWYELAPFNRDDSGKLFRRVQRVSGDWCWLRVPDTTARSGVLLPDNQIVPFLVRESDDMGEEILRSEDANEDEKR